MRIAPAYSGPVVHVLDASRAVGRGRASSRARRSGRASTPRTAASRSGCASEHAARRSEKPLLSLEEARRRRTADRLGGLRAAAAVASGARGSSPTFPSRELVPYIDWSPFFSAWELRGTYPRIFENPEWGAKARELFDDAQAMLKRLVEGGGLKARAVYGFFPANAVGDDIEVYTDESRAGLLGTLHTLRQQADKGEGEPAQALADFVAPRETGLRRLDRAPSR